MSTPTRTAFQITPKADRVPAAERAELLASPGFGRVFSEHMAVVTYTEGKGWHTPQILPRQPLTLDPAASVLHYAQEIFEGMKAYRAPNGEALLFRPDANARRFRHSAERMAMAQLPEDLFLDAVTQLVTIDKDWIPAADVGTLYIRPFMIATEAALGVKPAAEFKFLVIACAAGEYFSKDAGPVSVWVEERTVRASRGGTGEAKCGGNYAASLTAQMEAKEHGCHQVLFLDAIERKWIEEMGGMNIVMVFDDGTILTPPLEGTILRGITRDSLLTLARDKGLTVREEPYAIDQLYADAKSGHLKEVFACGTAAVVTPIGTLKSAEGTCVINGGKTGEVTTALRKALCDIQYGRADDAHGWVKRVS
ncbi:MULTISPECIES: branched-chain amino acid aminotransferase [Acetobacter]|uniref:Probable branched-chain-amino-acid aminotransferase n=1 Tax=Acetobacter persici TaxID=1076596 RepID=A0A6V8I5U1_9PROT|nr:MULTISPECIES: branched-chain amino acid aminotransferase [Acetobacter]MBS1016497.1 branched-chain amino acid aminotransferase [Acetobacter persici]OUI92576.1 branched-chain amino acid aminotransferase [Acetobacter persici]GFE93018.1 branched-chain-amino-acid aminotransferase [Acetobacter persici]